jgi:hypothetical protein
MQKRRDAGASPSAVQTTGLDPRQRRPSSRCAHLHRDLKWTSRSPTRWSWAITLLVLLYASGSRACPDLAQAPHSRWHTHLEDGVSWLVTPCGQRFFSLGVNAMDGGQPWRLDRGRTAYHWGAFYPDLETWAQVARARVSAWGFNTVGGWSLHPGMLRLPTMPFLDLGRTARFHWFDPLHPATAERMRERARHLVAPYTRNPFRIGYFTDNEVGWWNGPLFTYHLKQPAANHTKQRLVAFLREHYGDDWGRFTSDFVPPADVASFPQLLHHEGVYPQLRPGGEGIQVVRRWTGVIAGHYYRSAHDAIRAADPEALILGDRLPIYYDPVAVRAMVPYVDVISTNYNVDSPDGWLARYFFDGLRHLAGAKPVLISEWFFAAHENRSGNRNHGHLMSVATQAERARGAGAAAARFAREPQVVGMHWFQYSDHPQGGRDDGEDYNFGLVDIHDHPYELLVDALSHMHRRVADLHRWARPNPSLAADAPRQVPHAAVDAQDRSLAEWPKEAALLAPLVAPEAEIAFGDLYVAWDHHGLHLAAIAMDYYDPDLLAYEEEFPLGEAFRIDWGVDAGAGPQRFALYVIPPKLSTDRINTAMRSMLCHVHDGTCDLVPSAVATYFGSDQPRITVEVSLPWPVLGVDGPPRGGMRMMLAATAWHRARWMSMSGLPPGEAMRDPLTWGMVTLGEPGHAP